MKTVLLNFLLLSVFISSFAQNSGVLKYSVTIKTTFGYNKIDKIIYFGNNKSIEFFIPKKIIPTITQKSETEVIETRVINTKKRPFLFKNIANQQLILSDHIGSKNYLITDTLNNFKWKITSVHKRISNYDCIQATASFRGRNYIAWFAESIPIALGPWKFGNLPGLIIKVSDSQEKFVYELTAIDLKAKFNSNLLTIPMEYKDEKLLTHHEFFYIYNKKIADYEKMSKVVHTYANGATGTVTIILSEAQEKF
ncbi:GLPGLI family protein [Pedobacter sp. Leaf41]|uniref:GLPGLI family protein n=1 Tax=Pedobacter sp. Leaf41 TaxID=1736218 RepID=UPI0009EC8B98|nr:GLPGLI family protein [Pedobacter sp. Leaf41]